MLSRALSDFSFHLLGPMAKPGADDSFHVRRADGTVATLIQTQANPLEVAIAHFGGRDSSLKQRLHPLLSIRRMSRLMNAAVINTAVGEMADGEEFVNVGVWNGFTMLAAMAGNEHKNCCGVDNFSEFGGPKDDFLEQFTARRSRRHRFLDQDYVDFFAAGLDRPLRVYLYDGEHSYENQYRGLLIADPFYADDAVIVVDDTNLDRARDATLQFAQDSRLEWEVIYDQRTSSIRHPTLWNGLMVLEAGGPQRRLELPVEDSIEDSLVAEGESSGGTVSVLTLGGSGFSTLEAEGLEVIPVRARTELRSALLEESTGRFVLIADEVAEPSPRAVERGVRVALERAQRASAEAKQPQ
jgi:Methyltransferase domain